MPCRVGDTPTAIRPGRASITSLACLRSALSAFNSELSFVFMTPSNLSNQAVHLSNLPFLNYPLFSMLSPTVQPVQPILYACVRHGARSSHRHMLSIETGRSGRTEA
jgi:hypothetical protein